jgi:hypothetical protein
MKWNEGKGRDRKGQHRAFFPGQTCSIGCAMLVFA